MSDSQAVPEFGPEPKSGDTCEDCGCPLTVDEMELNDGACDDCRYDTGDADDDYDIEDDDSDLDNLDDDDSWLDDDDLDDLDDELGDDDDLDEDIEI